MHWQGNVFANWIKGDLLETSLEHFISHPLNDGLWCTQVLIRGLVGEAQVLQHFVTTHDLYSFAIFALIDLKLGAFFIQRYCSLLMTTTSAPWGMSSIASMLEG